MRIWQNDIKDWSNLKGANLALDRNKWRASVGCTNGLTGYVPDDDETNFVICLYEVILFCTVYSSRVLCFIDMFSHKVTLKCENEIKHGNT